MTVRTKTGDGAVVGTGAEVPLLERLVGEREVRLVALGLRVGDGQANDVRVLHAAVGRTQERRPHTRDLTEAASCVPCHRVVTLRR
jgi:hypothetical protein